MANIEEKIEGLLKEKIEGLGYDLYDVEYSKEGPNYFLRIFIDKEDGIDLNDCETVNNAIVDMLDEADYIKEQYFLEVSSPGIERILRKDKHLESNIGKEVLVKLFKKDANGRKEYQGLLHGFSDDIIEIEGDSVVEIQRKNVSKINIVYNFE